MRPSLRFLTLTILSWGGLRAATLGILPGAQIFRVEASRAKLPPLVPTEFPPIAPLATENAPPGPPPIAYPETARAEPQDASPTVSDAVRPFLAGLIHRAAFDRVRPTPEPRFYEPIPTLEEWPLSSTAAASMPPTRSTVTAPAQSIPAALRRNDFDRLQLSAWAMLRSQQAGVAGTPSLGGGGTLGASQAGSRLSYNFTRQIAATVRTTSDVGRRGAEIAAGVRIQPIGRVPLWLTAERRQRLGSGGSGRNAFAIYFESGVYQRPMPWRFALDGYVEGGVVGHDGFVDGGMALTRPVYRRFSAGLGVWGGAQPGVYRVDAGPRISLRVRNNVRVDLDWRQRLAGNARPGSGPAVTLAGDF